jgi:hypothetical protein
VRSAWHIWNEFDKWFEEGGRWRDEEPDVVTWAKQIRMPISDIQIMIDYEVTTSRNKGSWVYSAWVKLRDDRLMELMGMWVE